MTYQAKREDLTTNLQAAMELRTEEEKRVLEEYASKIADLNKLALGWSEDYTDVINLEDELAHIKADFIDTKDFKTLLGGTPIEFKQVGKTYRPYLGGIEIKGPLKRKLVMHLTHGIEPKVTVIGGTPAVKYLRQYSTYALEIYVFENGNSFFKAYASAKAMQRKNVVRRAKVYSYEEADKINAGAFPEIELDALERALELLEELDNLAFKSDAVARALKDRTDDQSYQIKELELEVEELKKQLQ
jgi:hypothetical protein